MTAPQARPQVVTAAFWCWVIAALLLILFGMLSLTQANLIAFGRGAGTLFAVAGVALAFLAGRARVGHAGFRRAAVALALAMAVLLAVYALMSHGVLWLIPMVLAMVGAVLMVRPSAQAWFDAIGEQQ
jgi:hypothetical protein